MKLKRIPSNASWSRLEREYLDSKHFLIRLPNVDGLVMKSTQKKISPPVLKICSFLNRLTSVSPKKKTLVILGPTHLLPYAYHSIHESYKFRNLIALRLSKPFALGTLLPNEHFGAAIFTTSGSKAMNDVRKPYQRCKCCGNTVKDYGGKTHLMEMRGARVSDVWTDITMNRDSVFPSTVVQRLFEIIRDNDPFFHAYYLSMKAASKENERLDSITKNKVMPVTNTASPSGEEPRLDKIFNMDVLEGFREIPDGTVDFALVDPPYNISVKYGRFADNMDDASYLEWCKRWIDETTRTLKNGGILTSVNIPRWTLELFPYLQQKLSFIGWIAWDAFSYPSSRIIPAHYPILCFRKGTAGSTQFDKHQAHQNEYTDVLSPLNFGYCIRGSCLNKRTPEMIADRKMLSDLWTDIHRIRHNSFRYSHPTLMPQKLAKRLMLLCSREGDTVLDCFNGVGTTTLVAALLNRRFLGIEKNKTYAKTSLERHATLNKRGDPFARQAARSTSSSKGYRKKKTQNQVPKRELQIEVKRVANVLGRCPSKRELGKMGKYPLEVYFANFEDWAEITVATRRTGISKKVPNGDRSYPVSS